MAERDGLPDQAGDVIAGKYRIERVIGEGGMGVVYAARHVDLDELYAIKLMRTEGDDAGDAEQSKRFLREARACARLRGEHVARVHDVGKLDDGTPYMVMEHLTGVDLRKLFKQKGPLPVGEVVEYLLQTCEAIEEAHANGIIHRDLKPANLFLTRRSNGTPCIKVLDFGISKQIGGAAGLDVTNTTDMVGSPFYMSPEQMRSGRSADRRSDIWSLGVVMYELVGGAPPFRGESITEVCARVLQDPPISLASRVPGVSPAFEQIVVRCLEKDPEVRFQSATDLAEALRAARAGDPLALGPTSVRPAMTSTQDAAASVASSVTLGAVTRSGSPPSRSRLALAAVACVAVGAAFAAGLFLAQGPAAAPSSPGAAPDTSAQPAGPQVTAASAAPSGSSAAPALSAAPAVTVAPSASATAAASVKPRPSGREPAVAPQKGPRVVDYGDRQ
jgi:serine/threonine protein kinase